MFRVVEVSERAPEDPEWMGTKQKFWFPHPELGRCLFKLARPGTGEDWSEKLAAEICALLGLPHATYELATWMGQRGTVSPSFVAPGEALVHGNELLVASIEDYPPPGEEDRFHNSRHTIDAVLGTLDRSGASRTRGWDPLPGIETAADLFVGYILLDVLVGNTDRHHENWGIVESRPIVDPHTPAAPWRRPMTTPPPSGGTSRRRASKGDWRRVIAGSEWKRTPRELLRRSTAPPAIRAR